MLSVEARVPSTSTAWISSATRRMRRASSVSGVTEVNAPRSTQRRPLAGVRRQTSCVESVDERLDFGIWKSKQRAKKHRPRTTWNCRKNLCRRVLHRNDLGIHVAGGPLQNLVRLRDRVVEVAVHQKRGLPSAHDFLKSSQLALQVDQTGQVCEVLPAAALPISRKPLQRGGGKREEHRLGKSLDRTHRATGQKADDDDNINFVVVEDLSDQFLRSRFGEISDVSWLVGKLEVGKLPVEQRCNLLRKQCGGPVRRVARAVRHDRDARRGPTSLRVARRCEREDGEGRCEGQTARNHTVPVHARHVAEALV